MKKLVLIRHGESEWNKENRFTGWTDVDLSEKGIEEAHKGGKALKDAGFTFDIVFTSLLKRANRTLDIVLEELGIKNIEIKKDWRLNERHYGSLQGLSKVETAKKYGEEQVKIWRRSYDIPPPPLEVTTLPNEPKSESLKNVIERFMPYWNSDIAPMVKSEKHVLIVAHGNSLRALIKNLDNISDKDIVELNLPTGIPLAYELDDNLRPIRKYFLGSDEDVKKAMEEVTNQGRVK
ncbi:MAG: 2,3-diphosphoglycerate-dependent phosphoglycerate mutase [bacterium]|nr:2,3-diphosphoglycerate-dependent phosphoglycerate mutase [bacterium]